MDLLLYAGIACILVTGLLSGAWTTGYQQRGNFYADSKDDRTSKKKAANGFFIAEPGSYYYQRPGLCIFLNDHKSTPAST
ncbi:MULTISPECIES: DUF5316 family protein [Paenibacillus]|uniref:Uncharacterized protein n=2 Tax=Paenibacillus TaxID=44249 RepID=A0ABS4FID9_9BACL|nr:MULTISPECIES: DUF5316 family protein [Paenibacillus]MBP1896031.1 hypothetical protein [Paenibacillus lactis]MCM3495489.1 DUF5316 domain-containing protein [Paenibacillus lactis]